MADQLKKTGSLFIVSAPSGAGKTTLVNAVIEKLGAKHQLSRLVTYTSKKPRATEENGVDYHFLEDAEFQERIAAGFFLEWSGAYGAYYGTPAMLLADLAQGRSFIAVVDRSGAQRLSSLVESAVLVWIHTVDLETLEGRLRLRNTEDQEAIAHRLRLAQIEMAEEQERNLFHYHILNDFFENALKELEMIITQHIWKSRSDRIFQGR